MPELGSGDLHRRPGTGQAHGHPQPQAVRLLERRAAVQAAAVQGAARAVRHRAQRIGRAAGAEPGADDRRPVGRAPAGRAQRAGAAVRGRADVRQSPAEEPQDPGQVGAPRRRRVLPALRRRHAGIRAGGRPVPRLGACAGVRAAALDRSGQGPGAPARRPGGDSAGAGHGSFAGGDQAPRASGRQEAVRAPGPAGALHGGQRGRGEAAGQPHRLPGYRPVPRPPSAAPAHPARGGRQALPQPVLLHGDGHRACGQGRCAQHHQRRPVEDLPGLGAAQPGAQRLLRQAQARAGRRDGVAGGRSRRIRADLHRSADLLQLQAHGRRVRRAA
ncbi:hypothetical protein D3C81_1321880 [compost metagenome]